jgi:Zn-dependent peptidase ImmA (M78 family)
MNGIFVKAIPLSGRIRAFTTYIASDDDHVIVVNENKSRRIQREGILHELRHIMRHDPLSERSAIDLEREILLEGF